ncbi:DUF3592 domain-containing protein [Hymenobacter sp. UYP22]|uniref:DUF3592 domain-containing protein n=1 Tax=Hymenobacter sp. UYP22 TaxID=3156348 RepID=UPI0033954D4F
MIDTVFILSFLGVASLIGVLIFLNRGQYSRIEILRRGIRTQGEIMDLDLYGLDLLYRLPTVRFKIQNGQYVTFTSSAKTSVNEVRKGQKVEVCYLTIAPEQFVIVSGLDVLIRSETQATKGSYRLAKGEELSSRRRK